MLHVRKTAGSEVHKDKVRLSLVGEDRKLHEILLPPAAAVQVAVSILGVIRELPEKEALTQTQLASLFEAIFVYLGT